MFSLDWIIFFLSSAITLAAIYYKLRVQTLQQAVAVLLIILIFFLNKSIFSRTKQMMTTSSRLALLFFSSLIIQLIILSTGSNWSWGKPGNHFETHDENYLYNRFTKCAGNLLDKVAEFETYSVEPAKAEECVKKITAFY